MTDFESIQILSDIYDGWERWNPHNDSLCSKQSEALGKAISALREKTERSKGCEYCCTHIVDDKDHGKIVETIFNNHLCTYDSDGAKGEIFNFCPMCGRELKPKEVQA